MNHRCPSTGAVQNYTGVDGLRGRGPGDKHRTRRIIAKGKMDLLRRAVGVSRRGARLSQSPDRRRHCYACTL